MKDYRYIKIIIDEINLLAISDPEIKEELIDHYCSFYEQIQGVDNDKMDRTINEIKNLNMSKLYEKRNGRKSYLMVFSSILLLGFIISAYSYNQNLDESLFVEHNQCAMNSLTNFESFEEPPYGNPLKVMQVSSNYGNRTLPGNKGKKFHHGIDLKAPLGTPIYVVESGTVVDCGFNKKRGFFIDIQHDETYTTRYFHLQEIAVKKGQKVLKDDVLGKVGSTGLSLAPHLHYEIIKSGESVDPIDYLKA